MSNYSLTIKERKQAEKIVELIQERITLFRVQDPYAELYTIWINPMLYEIVIAWLEEKWNETHTREVLKAQPEVFFPLVLDGIPIKQTWDEKGFDIDSEYLTMETVIEKMVGK